MKRMVLALALLLVPALAVAAQAAVTLVSDDVLLAQRLSGASSKAVTTVHGAGDRLTLSSTADADFDLYIFPLQMDGTADTKGALHAVIPGGTAQEASVDLTVSPAWTMGERAYKVYVLSGGAKPVSLFRVEINQDPGRNWAGIALRQFLQPEMYRPSSYHRLAGYHILGFSFGVLLGILLLVLAAVAAFIKRRLVLPILLTGFLLYGARVSADLLGWSVSHVIEWRGGGTYEQAGSMYQIASVLQVPYARDAKRPISLALCHDGSSYLPTLLQYLVYPIPVAMQRTEATTHLLVMQKVDWDFHDGTLRCGKETMHAQSIEKFPDGSILYALLT